MTGDTPHITPCPYCGTGWGPHKEGKECTTTMTNNTETMEKTINAKAVEYGTCDLQQIAKIDKLISQARQEEREKIIKLYGHYTDLDTTTNPATKVYLKDKLNHHNQPLGNPAKGYGEEIKC